jgi:hypothetical protein
MLGALLGALQTVHPPDFLDDAGIEDENEDSHWASDTNRFEDWFLHDASAEATPSDPKIYY